MGISAVVGSGIIGPIGGKVEIRGVVRHRGGASRGWNGAGRDAMPGMREGCTKVAT